VLANELKCLPRSVANLPRLAHLCVSGNELEGLPLTPFVSLPRVFIDGNPAINHLPFIFGCQQTVATYSAQRRQLSRPGNQVSLALKNVKNIEMAWGISDPLVLKSCQTKFPRPTDGAKCVK